MEDCEAKTKKLLVSLEYCVLFPNVIRFPSLCLKPQTYNHSKFSQSKNTRTNHSVNYCTLSQKIHIQERLGRAYCTSCSTKFHLRSLKKDLHKVIEMSYTISTLGLRIASVSAQLIYFLSPAGDRLFYFLLPPMTLLNSNATRFVTTKTGIVYPQAGNITLAEQRTPFSFAVQIQRS